MTAHPETDFSVAQATALRELMAVPRGRVHLLGICGIGTAGLARVLHQNGWEVSGCDAAPNRLADWLMGFGIRVLRGHNPEHISRELSWVVRSSAVNPDCEEVRRARETGLPVFRRGEVLATLLQNRRAVVVSGTHGKTTTATWITLLLRSAGLEPGWCIGGESPLLEGIANNAEPESPMVVEGDESDGTLALYEAEIAVVTNIDLDHMENFATPQALENCFFRFARNARRRVIFCADDPRTAALLSGLPTACSYGFASSAVVRASDVVESERSTTFTLLHGTQVLTRVALPVLGRHNVLNALAAAAVGIEFGLSAEQLRTALQSVRLPRRRMEKVAECCGVAIFSDYGHHPTEIGAVIRTLRRLPHRRLLILFQPHRFTRTRALGPNFPAAFEGAHQVLLTPVYAASEATLKGGTVWDLYAQFRKKSPTRDVRIATSLEQAYQYLRHELRSEDILLILGAGDIEKVGGWLQEAVRTDSGGPRSFDLLNDRLLTALQTRTSSTRITRDFPLSRQTTLGVGGTADLWCEPESEADLVSILSWAFANDVPLHVLGGGSNTLVSDLGVRGMVIRLSGACFCQIKEQNGEVVAGAGVPLALLLDWLEARYWSGLEFLEGIPGTIGGALRMNAGAWGEEIVRFVSWVRCFDMDGTLRTLNSSELGARYRCCTALVDRVVVEARFKLTRGEGTAIRVLRREFAERRRWMRGLRCAGSIFRNPENEPAGRLIERAGLKNMRVGGASVFEGHANVIVTNSAARASDVRALLELIRMEVKDRLGVDLEPEVVFFE
ncbi:MAG: UDP-N-acetylmuramate--L-alanine ligase [Kiritimatiellia bacterium]